ncbi:MAG: hypothetical protein K6G38_03965 [Gammaproteobacteria bacterium]|nr:hypothetical protein [Gammaproteobacteria bacterium]
MFNLWISKTPLDEAPRLGMVFLGLYDLIPVVLYLIGSVILLRTLYNKMVKGCYVLTAGGAIMVFVAGVLKALHKILIGALNIDYVILDKQFTSTQSIGFILLFIGLIGMFTKYNKNYTKVRSIALLPLISFITLTANTYDSSLPFIALMVIGAAGSLIMLIYMAIRMKSKVSVVIFIIAIIVMVSMGYLSTQRYFEYAWIAITTNIIYQGSYLLGIIILSKKGLGRDDIFFKKDGK